jgi:hypothetical protein
LAVFGPKPTVPRVRGGDFQGGPEWLKIFARSPVYAGIFLLVQSSIASENRANASKFSAEIILTRERRKRFFMAPERIRQFEFPDPRSNLPVPISREFSRKAQWLRRLFTVGGCRKSR